MSWWRGFVSYSITLKTFYHGFFHWKLTDSYKLWAISSQITVKTYKPIRLCRAVWRFIFDFSQNMSTISFYKNWGRSNSLNHWQMMKKYVLDFFFLTTTIARFYSIFLHGRQCRTLLKVNALVKPSRVYHHVWVNHLVKLPLPPSFKFLKSFRLQGKGGEKMCEHLENKSTMIKIKK